MSSLNENVIFFTPVVLVLAAFVAWRYSASRAFVSAVRAEHFWDFTATRLCVALFILIFCVDGWEKDAVSGVLWFPGALIIAALLVPVISLAVHRRHLAIGVLGFSWIVLTARGCYEGTQRIQPLNDVLTYRHYLLSVTFLLTVALGGRALWRRFRRN